MKLSISELKRRLPAGTEFTGEFVGRNRQVAAAGMSICRRRVVKQGTQMVCVFLDGPKQGEQSYLTWRGVSAKEIDGAIVLSDEGEEFFRITFEKLSGGLACANVIDNGSCVGAAN